MTVQTETPEWAQRLIAWVEDPEADELNFKGVEVPGLVETLLDRAFTASIEDMELETFEINSANGWYDTERTVGDDIANLHGEVSEMFEAFRDGGLEDRTEDIAIFDESGSIPKPEGFGSECADVFIRLLDTCRRRGIDLRFEYERKSAFNRTRGYRHGGKLI